jgi:hypothetical protein
MIIWDTATVVHFLECCGRGSLWRRIRGFSQQCYIRSLQKLEAFTLQFAAQRNISELSNTLVEVLYLRSSNNMSMRVYFLCPGNTFAIEV